MQRWFLPDHNDKIKVDTPTPEDMSGQKSITSEKPTAEKTFTVTVEDVEPREGVYLSGNVPELGEWQYDRLVSLVPQGGSVWSATVALPAHTEISYRYCIAGAVVTEESHKVSIHRWETNLYPRRFPDDEFETKDVFGSYNDSYNVDKGWLIEDTLVQFKLFPDAIRFKKRNLTYPLNIKITPMKLHLNTNPCTAEDASLSGDTGDLTDSGGAHVEAAVLDENSCAPSPQSQFGTLYRNTDILIVNVRAPEADEFAYLLDVYSTNRAIEEHVPIHVASAYLLGDGLQKSSQMRLELPLMCHVRQRPIGSIRFDTLVVRPIANPLCDLSVSYCKRWNPKWAGLDIGHRGLGASFKDKETLVRENTIASLKSAVASGADFLEFDVQLSKDLVPVIYHDYYVCISMKRKKKVDFADMLELPVKDLTLDQLHKLKVYHLVEGRTRERRFNDEELEEHQPFPTLRDALAALGPHVGFNVELKWTMELQDGTFELNNPFDINLYVDKVLEVLLKHGGDRRIVLSGFNPDVCTMLRNKQNKYPVMFLTQGVTERYPRYYDERCTSIPAAVRHALHTDILGIVAHTEDILRDPSQVKLAKDAGLVVFCWGEDNNDKETISKLKRLGLHAVIYDKMDQYNTKEVKESIFLLEARESQKELMLLKPGGGSDAACGAGAAGAGAAGAGRALRSVSHAAQLRAMDTAVHGVPDAASVSTEFADTALVDLAPPAPPAPASKRNLIDVADKELQHKKSSSFLGLFGSERASPPSPHKRASPHSPHKRSRSDDAPRS